MPSTSVTIALRDGGLVLVARQTPAVAKINGNIGTPLVRLESAFDTTLHPGKPGSRTATQATVAVIF